MRHSGWSLLSLVLALAVSGAASAPLPDTVAAKSVPKGHGAWLYPENIQQVNEFAANLTKYNSAAGPNRAIRVVYIYSMDVDVDNFKPVIGALVPTAARVFRAIPYVTHVAVILDGWYTDYSDYSNGDFNSLTSDELVQLADAYARLYCSPAASYINGLQLDLEPFAGKFRTAMMTFAGRLSQNLRDPVFCPSPAYGKFVSFFAGPRQATADLYDALGPNGYVIISGYDLDSPGAGLPETPEQYSINLLSNLRFVKDNAARSKYGRYSIGLPFAASACEFEMGINLKDPSRTIQGYPMYSATKPSYIPNAFNVMSQVLGPTASQASSPYLGISMWAFLSRDVKAAGYRHTPKNAFDTPGMMAYLAKNMPIKYNKLA